MWTGPDIAKHRPLVLGKYRLVAELGQGGMADVYLAATEGVSGPGSLIVIKWLRNIDEPQLMAMFLDEARIARRLVHPNVVQTHEIGQEGASHLIVMEYLRGPTLHTLRRHASLKGGVPRAFEVEIVCQVLDGLHYAHSLRAPDGRELQVVHRDLSPENVIVTETGVCKVLDFGIAKAIDSLSHTQAGFCKGKLKNMPPEQLLGHRVDRRADIFAAGVLLWEGLSGRPFWGDLGNAGVASRLARGDLPSLAELAPEVDSGLGAICANALAVSADDRYATALEFKEALVAYAQNNHLAAARTELAAFVDVVYAADRRRIDGIVQSQLARSEAVSTPLPLPRVDLASSPERSTGVSQWALHPTARTLAPAPVIVPEPRPSLGGTRRRRTAAVAIGALLLAGGVLTSRRSPRDEPPATPPAQRQTWVKREPPAALPVMVGSAEGIPAPRSRLETADGLFHSRQDRRRRATGSARGRALRASRGIAEVPETPLAPAGATRQGDAPWAGRTISSENPYVGPPAEPRLRPPHTIDRNNPWPPGQ